jgi:uncharacterized protein (DUF2062 family)
VKSWPRRVRAALETLSPEQAALLFSVGLVLGVFPIVGFPSVLCLLAAFGLRLNVAALQALNNLCSPLQWALWLPLEKAGAWLCGRAACDWAGGGGFGSVVWHAIAGWACICVPLGALLYSILAFTLRRRRGPAGGGPLAAAL